MSKTWSDVEREYAASLIAKQKMVLSSAYGELRSNKKRRTLKVMDELEKNSFIKMFNEGWCKSCDFDSSKCAKQHECEAFKVVNKAINKEEKDSGDENGN